MASISLQQLRIGQLLSARPEIPWKAVKGMRDHMLWFDVGKGWYYIAKYLAGSSL